MPFAQKKHTLRIGATLGVPTVLRELGGDPAKQISQIGFDVRMFDSPDNRLSLAARGRLLDRCARETGCAHFGLMVGSRFRLESLGIVGLLAKHAPDVGTALRSLSKFFYLHADGVAIELTVDGGVAVLSYTIEDAGIPGIAQTCDGAVAAMLNFMKDLCGPDFRATEAWFARPRPDDVDPYRKIMRVRLEFNAAVYALVFSSTWLTRQLPPTEEALSRLIQEKVAEQARQHARSFPEQVQSVMRTALHFNHFSADKLAMSLGLHVRTFHRRLSDEGVSYQELLDKTRCAVACKLLEYDEKTMPQIAELLGYAEMRSFIRAFKRWTGLTPTNWRDQRKKMPR